MDGLLFFWFVQLLVYGDFVEDPSHVAWAGATEVRQFDCERISQAEAHKRYPGSVPATSARGQVFYDIDALVCSRRYVDDDQRLPRDELLLRSLSSDVDELVGIASKQGGDVVKWTVDAFHPDPVMVRKIATAAKTSLAERGLQVSDRPPLLTAGDVEVLRSMHMQQALPVACKRMQDTGVLDDDTAFVSVALLHEYESALHVGLCHQGRFKWLR